MARSRSAIEEKPATTKQLLNSEVYVVLNTYTGELEVYAEKDKAYGFAFENELEKDGVMLYKRVIKQCLAYYYIVILMGQILNTITQKR